MKTRSLTAILTVVLVGLVAGLSIWIQDEKADPGSKAFIALTPWGPSTPAAEGSEAAPRPAVPRSAPAQSSRQSAVSKAAAARADVLPEDAVWLEGRVVFQGGTPRDEVMFVEAYGDPALVSTDQPPWVHRVRVAVDGRFRLAFPPDSRRGWVGVAARYHFQAKAREVDLTDSERSFILEPRLGGRIAGRLHVPGQAGFAGTRLRARGARQETAGDQRFATPDESGRFELHALPPNESFLIELAAPHLVDARLAELKLAPGELRQLELEVGIGVSLAGKVVDSAGRALVGATVSLLITHPSDSGGTAVTRFARSDEGGEFLLRALPPGDFRIDCESSARLPARLDLGPLHEGESRTGISVVMRAGAAIEGIVRWPDGRPAQGARVSVVQRADSAWDARGLEAHEDLAEDGRFRIAGLASERSRLIARAEDPDGEAWMAALEDVAPGTSGVVVTLGRGPRVSGRALDDLGRPLTSFELVVTPEGDDAWDPTRQILVRAFDDESGCFELRGLEPGSWSFSARAQGHAAAEPVELRLVTELEGIELRLSRQAAVNGRVVGPLGRPIAGAEVSLLEQAAAAALFRESLERRATTDAAGEYRFGGLRPGSYELFARAAPNADSPSFAFELGPGASLRGIELRLRTPASLSGEVHAPRDILRNRRVVLNDFDSRASRTLELDAHGKFHFEGLVPGSWSIALLSIEEGVDSRDARLDELSIELGPGEARHIVLGAPPTAPLFVRGHLHESGRSIRGATVTCRSAVPGERRRRQSARTDAEGRFELTLDGGGIYAFTVDSGHGGLVDFELELPDRATFELELAMPSASLSGLVRGPGGAPLAGVPLALIPRLGGGARGWARDAQSDEAGRYEFVNLGTGTYDLQAGGATDLGRALVPGIELAGGEERKIDLSLRAGGTLEGLVTGADGEPLAGAWLEFEDDAGRRLFARSTTRTDAKGRFKKEGLAAGRVHVRARSAGRSSAAREVSVIEGGASEVRLSLDD